MRRKMSQLPHIALLSPQGSLAFDREGCRAGRTSLLKHAAGAQAHAGRLDLMLAIAFRQRVPRAAFSQFLSAVENSRRGEQALANLRLALSGLSQIRDVHDLPERIEKVEILLSGGMEPEDVLAALDLDEEADFRKYDQAQPRVPAGSGPESGRWTSGSSGGAASSAAAVALRAAPLLDASFGPLALRAATAFFGGLGFGTAFGLLVVPSPNSVSTSGPMPGDAGQTYSLDQPTGVLRVLDAAGQVLAAGVRDKSGVFADADTGVPFARALDGTIVFGSAAIAVSAQRE